ncbi:MAG TPA: hypothetical protein VN517_18720 [Terriglobales bacterium]|nr:hypothetical protein [Terriglobales bacterium]
MNWRKRTREDEMRTVHAASTSVSPPSRHTSASLRAQGHIDDGKAGGVDQASLCI